MGRGLLRAAALAIGLTGVAQAEIPPLVPLVGSWDGGRPTQVGLWLSEQRIAVFDDDGDGRANSIWPALGNPGDVPIVGDWNGDGKDTIALYRPSTAELFYYDSYDGPPAGSRPTAGHPDDIPIAGDWDGDGIDGFALYCPETRQLSFFQTVTGPVCLTRTAGDFGDLPLAGDWDGNSTDGFAMFKPWPSTRTFWLYQRIGDQDPTWSSPSIGNPGDIPIVGDWNGDKVDTIGVFRPSSREFWLYDDIAAPASRLVTWTDHVTAADVTSGRQVFYENGAPHTDSNGRLRFAFDQEASFFPLGVYGVDSDVFATLASAGFNMGLIKESYGPFEAARDARSHGIKVVLEFAAPSKSPLVGRFGRGDDVRFGVWDGGNGSGWLDRDGDGKAEERFWLGGSLGEDLPIVGDWDGNGTETLALYRPSTGVLRYYNDFCTDPAGLTQTAGHAEDIPFAGDWDGDGIDGFALYRPSTREYTFFQTVAGPVCLTRITGDPDDQPLGGSWDRVRGDGFAVFKPSTRTFWLYQRIEDQDPTYSSGSIGNPGDIPIAGDWNKDGVDTVGVYRRAAHGEALEFWLYDDLHGDPSRMVDLGNPLFRAFLEDDTVIGWYFFDELSRCGADVPDECKEVEDPLDCWLTKVAAQFAAYQPLTDKLLFGTDTWYADCNDSIWDRVAGFGDATCHDVYRVYCSGLHRDGLIDIADVVGRSRLDVDGKQPCWFVPQAFEQRNPGDFCWVLPTPNQYRATVYTAIIHGATGLITFALDSQNSREGNVVGISPNPPVRYSEGVSADPGQIAASIALWSGIDAAQRGINAELLALREAILSATSTMNYRIFSLPSSESANPVRALMKDLGQRQILLAVNLADSPVDALIQLTGGSRCVKVLFEDRMLRAPTGGFRDWFAPYQVHVYEIRPNSAKGNLDGDCDVDLDDLALWEACASGPAIPVFGGCTQADLDGDGDVDQSDFGIFQRCYSGTGKPADPDCAD